MDNGKDSGMATARVTAIPDWTTPQPRAVSGWAISPHWEVALAQSMAQVMTPDEVAPDVLVLFASVAYMDDYESLLSHLKRDSGARIVIGCSVQGIVSGTCEVEDEPGLALMALWLPGADLHTVYLADGEDATPGLLGSQQGASVRGWFMLAEPYRVDALPLIHALKGAFPGRPIFGGMASGVDRDQTGCLFLDTTVHRQGAVALGIGGDYEVAACVSQGSIPIGESWTITEVDHNALLGISGRPALEVLQETIATLSPAQRERAQNNVTVGLAVDEYLDSYAGGDFFVRGILGIDRRRDAVVIGGLPRVGQTLQFHLRDPAMASADMMRTMATFGQGGDEAVAVITCTCAGRGAALFGEPGHDAGVISGAYPGVPLLGAFCPGEIGPLGKTTVIHSLTATTGVIQRYIPPSA